MRGNILPALAICGCAALVRGRAPSSKRTMYLLRAEEDVTIIAQPEEEEGEGEGEGIVAAEKTWQLGIRVGMFVPNDNAEGYDSYDPGPLFGVFYRGLQLAEKSLAFEAGGEYASAQAKELKEDSNLIRLRASVLYGKWYSESSTKFYVSGGGAMLMEKDAMGGSATLGAGLVIGKLDLRFGMSFLLGGQEALTVTTATAGYLF